MKDKKQLTENQVGCGYCTHEKKCAKRAALVSNTNKRGSTKELAENCKEYKHYLQ